MLVLQFLYDIKWRCYICINFYRVRDQRGISIVYIVRVKRIDSNNWNYKIVCVIWENCLNKKDIMVKILFFVYVIFGIVFIVQENSFFI